MSFFIVNVCNGSVMLLEVLTTQV